jgi:DNA-nicking Smr family endonuclease
VACLDLHGYRKEAAIRAVTDFVERISSKQTRDSSVWVSIITGSGQHSTDGEFILFKYERKIQCDDAL